MRGGGAAFVGGVKYNRLLQHDHEQDGGLHEHEHEHELEHEHEEEEREGMFRERGGDRRGAYMSGGLAATGEEGSRWRARPAGEAEGLVGERDEAEEPMLPQGSQGPTSPRQAYSGGVVGQRFI